MFWVLRSDSSKKVPAILSFIHLLIYSFSSHSLILSSNHSIILSFPPPMRQLFLFTLLTFQMATMLSGQTPSIVDTWSGALNVQGQKLRIVFHINQEGDELSATMDSPDQGTKGIPVDGVRFEENVLSLAIRSIGFSYKGEMTKDGNELKGKMEQRGAVLKLDLKRGGGSKLKRPQEPKPPFSYIEEAVEFKNDSANISLSGTLSHPKGNGPFPTAILISGSGPQNRNSEIMGHKPFLVISDYLVNNLGMAVLRYDERGVGESEGNFATATSYDFASDVEAAFAYLKSRKDIDAKHIGLIGHSEGGLVAPMVAAAHEDVAFLILLAAPGLSGDLIIVQQTEDIARASGVAGEALEMMLKQQKERMVILNEHTDPEKAEQKLRSHFYRIEEKLPSREREASIESDAVLRQAKTMASPWYINFVNHDPAPFLEKVKCPVLALNGALDLQVAAKANINAIETALQKGGNQHYRSQIFPNLNHLFQTAKTGLPAEYPQIEETFSPEALKVMFEWLMRQVRG